MTHEPDHWVLDKRIPIALIVTVFLQFGAGVWFAAQMQSDIRGAQADIARHDAEIRSLELAAQAQAVQLGRIEGAIIDMRDDIARLIRALEANKQ